MQNDMKLSVAVIEPVGGHGGMNLYDFGLCNGLANAGTRVLLFTCEQTDVPEDLAFDVHHTYCGIYGADPKILRAFRYLSGLFKSIRIARREKINIVHLHFFHATLLEYLTVRMIKLLGFHIVITAHDVESFVAGASNQYLETIYKMADRVVVHNKVSQAQIIKKARIDEGKTALIPAGHFMDFFVEDETHNQAREKLGLPLGVPILLFFGQIKQVKGLDLLLQALPGVLEDFPDLKLVIAGKVWKDDFSKYDELIDRNNLKSAIIKDIRYVPDEQAASYYRAADLVVLPYRRIYQSAVLLMAMGFGATVVVSDIPGMTEIVVNKVNGYVFKTEDANELTHTLRAALKNPLRESIGEAGQRTVFEDHDWDMIGQKTSNLYQSLS